MVPATLGAHAMIAPTRQMSFAGYIVCYGNIDASGTRLPDHREAAMSSAGLFNPTRVALLVVDEQERLMSAIHEADRVVRNSRKMLQAATALGMPVVYTEQYPKGLGGTLPAIRELLHEQLPIEKTVFGCFKSAAFTEALGQFQVDTLLIAGVETHICVFQTAAQAIERGLSVHILSDAVGARTPERHSVGMERLRQLGAVISDTDMAIYEYLGEAATPLFRQVLPLLKE